MHSVLVSITNSGKDSLAQTLDTEYLNLFLNVKQLTKACCIDEMPLCWCKNNYNRYACLIELTSLSAD